MYIDSTAGEITTVTTGGSLPGEIVIDCHHRLVLTLGFLGTLEAECLACPLSFPVTDFNLSILRDRLKCFVQQIISAEDEEAINQLYCELILGVKETEQLLEEMRSLQKLAGYVISSR